MSLFLLRLKILCSFFFVLTVSFVTPVFSLPSAVEVTVAGVKVQVKSNVEAALGLPPGIVRDGQVDRRWLLRFVEQIPGLAEKALQPFGYYQSEITADLKETDELYRIKVKVAPGDPVRVRKLALRITGPGADKAKLKKERSIFPLKKKDVLRHEFYETGKKSLLLKAVNMGYLEAAYTINLVTVYPEEGSADIELELTTGVRYRFGTVSFEGGLDRFDESFLRRFISFSAGDVFSHRELHNTRINFYQANRFNEVLMVPRMDLVSEDLKVPIVVKLTPGPQQSLRPGVGYGTNTGGRVSLNYQNTQVMDRPDVYSLDLLLAEKAQSLISRYTIPQMGHWENNLIGTFAIVHEDIDTYETQIVYTELEQTYGLGSGKTGAYFLRYSREDSDIGTDDNISHLLTPGIRYYQRTYDDPLHPRAGYQFRLELRGSHDKFLSDTTLGQILGAGSFMWPLTQRFTLHTRVEAATTFKDDAFSEIPASMRFFVGGDSSVRG
ncbi:MAG: BamA/TamA family outer membrane protein, partial [Desulfuromonadales bacterium]|nr:BamA/TamA family outer membrane protein [Desulfuromonadales bacterium]